MHVRGHLVRFPRGIVRCPTRNVARSMTIQWSSVHTSRHAVRSHCGHRGNWTARKRLLLVIRRENANNRRKKKGDERVITEGETTNKKMAPCCRHATAKKQNKKSSWIITPRQPHRVTSWWITHSKWSYTSSKHKSLNHKQEAESQSWPQHC